MKELVRGCALERFKVLDWVWYKRI